MNKTITLLLASLLLAAAPVLGGPLLKSQVGEGANWVVHLDYDQLVKSRIGQLIRAEMATQGLEEKLQDFKTMFSFHPIDDIRNVTLYGNGHDRQKAVALFEGAFDQNKLVALVRMNAEYEEIEYGDIIVHSWVDENKKECIYNDDRVILGAGLDAVKQAVDVLKGSAPNAADGVFNQAALNKVGAFFQVAANAVGDIAENNNEAEMLEQTDEFGGVVGEDDGQLYVNLSLRAKSEEDAQNVKKMLEGMIAFLTLAGNKEPVLAELAKKLDVSLIDRTITVYFQAEPDAIISFLKEQWDKKNQNQV